MEREYSIGVILENISQFLNVFPILSTTILLTAVQNFSICTPNTLSKKYFAILRKAWNAETAILCSEQLFSPRIQQTFRTEIASSKWDQVSEK